MPSPPLATAALGGPARPWRRTLSVGVAAAIILCTGQAALLLATLRSGSPCEEPRTGALGAGVGGQSEKESTAATFPHRRDESSIAARQARWDLWPYGESLAQPGLRLGIVTGGSSDLFGGGAGAYGDATSCLLLLLARRRRYAFYAERAMQRYGSDRPVAWQKVRLLLERLDDVDLIVWADADIAWTAGEVDLAALFTRQLSTRAACTRNLGQERWDAVAGSMAVASVWEANSASGIILWASADVRPRQRRNMNLNSAVLALRTGTDAKRFLEAVWAEGNEPLSFQRHNPGWRKQPPGHHYWGWPFEQGGVWAVLDRERDLLQRTCIVAAGTLHSVEYHRWQPGGALSAHMPGMPAMDRRRAACSHLAAAITEPGCCTNALKHCPDLFAGRLIAAHAEGLCEHCLPLKGHAAVVAAASDDASSESDWSLFDCGCLRPQ